MRHLNRVGTDNLQAPCVSGISGSHKQQKGVNVQNCISNPINAHSVDQKFAKVCIL